MTPKQKLIVDLLVMLSINALISSVVFALVMNDLFTTTLLMIGALGLRKLADRLEAKWKPKSKL